MRYPVVLREAQGHLTFIGGMRNYVLTLRKILERVNQENPTRAQLVSWLKSEYKVSSETVSGDLIIGIYRRLAKKRYLRGKYAYDHERIYVPIPSRLHDIVRPFLNQYLRISITRQNGELTITLHPVKTFRHAEKSDLELKFQHDNAKPA